MSNTETVEYVIITNAQQSILALEQLTKSATTFNSKIDMVKIATRQFASDFGVSGKTAVSILKDYDKALDVSGQGSRLFGAVGKQAWGEIGQSIQNTERPLNTFKRGVDAIRIAMGTLIAMAIFRFLNFIEESLRTATETAKEFETSLYRLANVEKILSESGIDVSMDSLKKSIVEIKKQFPLVSETDITQIVSLVGIMTKELGLSETQIVDLTKSIIALNIRSAETEEPLQTAQKVLNSLITSGKGIGTLGISFSETNMKAKAMELGFIKAGESLEKLTEAQRGQTKLAIVLASTGNEVQNVNDYLETNVGRVQESSAAWEDFLRVLGQFTLGLKAAAAPALIEILKILTDAVNMVKTFVIILQGARNVIDAFKAGLRGEDLGRVFTASLEEGFNRFFSGQLPDNAPEWFKKLFGKFAETADTATTGINALQESLDNIDTSKAQKEIDDLNKDLEKLDQKKIDITAEFNVRQGRELADHITDMTRQEQDYQIRRQRFIDDANQRIEDENQNYHDHEIDAEARFQEQLRQLRQRYLYDLEGALRERDAGQVLRLQAKYQMDREALENERALQQQADATRHAEQVRQAQEDRDERLRQMDEDHRLEMERREQDYQIKHDREREDFLKELADLEAQRKARIEEAAKAISDEYDLKEGAAQALQDLLNAYYGPGGAFDGLYDYTNKSMVAKAQLMMQQLAQIIQASQQAAQAVQSALGSATITGGATSAGAGGRPYTPRPSFGNIGHQAGGGTYLATKATRATFGEAGAELATFIPLGRPGASGSRTGASTGDVGGRITIEMLLSPDLEARVMDNTLNKTADVILRTVGSK